MFSFRRLFQRRERQPEEYYHEIRLLDPADLDEYGCPKQVAVVGLLLDRPRRKILCGPNPNLQLTRSLVRVLGPDERRLILKGGNYFNYERCCARCGTGLRIDSCEGCHRSFHDDHISQSTGISLPPLARTWLKRHGHTFER